MTAGTPDWEARFAALTVNTFDIARDAPDRGIVVCGRSEPHQLHAWDRATGSMRRVTDAPNGMTGGAISADGTWVLWVDDPDAREEGVLVKARFDGGPPERVDPALPPAPILGIVTDGGQVAFSAAIGDRVEHRIAALDGSGSRLVATDDSTSWVAAFADAGRTLMVARFRADETREVVLWDVASGARTALLEEPGVSMRAYLPSPIAGDSRVIAESDASGLQRPLVWDRASGLRQPLPIDGLDGNVRPIAWSPDGETVLLLQILRAELRFHLLDLATGRRRELPTPPGVVTALPDTFATTFVSSGEILTLWQSGAHPRSVLSIPLSAGEPRIVVGDDAPPPGRGWQHVEFASSDGTPLQGWLALPDGEPPYPAVIDVHGGPGVVQLDEYLPHLAAFVDQGFVVLTLNYRSSSTFGTAFERAPVGRLGELEVEDIAAARDHLVRAGLADPARVLVEGWSYGGYLTLMALGRRPDDWAGGICGVGIGDLGALHAEAAPFIRDMFTAWMEGSPGDVPDRYAAASPITYADNVRAPVLVIHGSDDIRCPPGQMRRYLARMAELGKEVEVEWFAAGHTGGLANPSIFREHTRRMLEFARRATG